MSMTPVMWLLGAAVAAVIWLVARTVVQGEYLWWGPLLAKAILRVARATVPKLDRDLRYAEWQGELDTLQEGGTAGVIFACTLVVAATRIRVGELTVGDEASEITANSAQPLPVRKVAIEAGISAFSVVKVAIKNGYVVSAREVGGAGWKAPKRRRGR